MTKTNFCELSDMTSQWTFPWNFGATWNFVQAWLLQNSDWQFLYPVGVSSPPTFWVLTGKQSVYFLLEQGVLVIHDTCNTLHTSTKIQCHISMSRHKLPRECHMSHIVTSENLKILPRLRVHMNYNRSLNKNFANSIRTGKHLNWFDRNLFSIWWELARRALAQ